MEEDPEGGWDWEMQGSKESSGMVMSWIWSNGLTLGKRILVTGFVMSSAPLVLPPLLVFSAIGFAFSVPCGLFLASYACTEKLMSKLLPGPSPSPNNVLDYGTEEDVGVVGNLNIAKEEEQQLEDIKGVVEMRNELVGKRNEDEDNISNGDIYVQRGLEKNKRGLMEEESEIVEVNGYDEEKLLKETELEIEGIGEDKEEEPLMEERRGFGNEALGVMIVIEGDEIDESNIVEEDVPNFEVENLVVELCEGRTNAEDVELERETRGLIQNIRDEGEADNQELDEYRQQSVENITGGAKKRHVQDKNAYDSGNLEAPVRALKRVRDQNGVEKVPTGTGSVEVEQVDKEAILLKGQEQDSIIGNGIQREVQLNREYEIVCFSNADARETADESGLHLFDYRKPQGSEYSSDTINKFATSSFEVTVLSNIHESKDARIHSEQDIDVASSKMPKSEKIWEQIDALKRIVGYTSASSASCVEEVKALYVFTGVEPPASFEDPSDLVEVDDKLRFLMTIVGVK